MSLGRSAGLSMCQVREPCHVCKSDVGFQVSSGHCQSMPPSIIDSCVSATEPLFACGQMKRPRLGRLARHRPSPVHHSNLTRSPRRPRNTNTCPLNESSYSAVWTLAARPLKPERMSVVPAASLTRVPAGRPIIAAADRAPAPARLRRAGLRCARGPGPAQA